MAKAKKNATVIFRASYTRKDGTVVYAKQYGLKAFPIPVNKK